MNTQEIIETVERHRDSIINRMIDFVINNVDVNYQIDLYYYPKDNSYTEFVNVGGNSWLNDDHITLMSIIPGWFQTDEDVEYFEEEGAEVEFDRVMDDLRYQLDEEEHDV